MSEIKRTVKFVIPVKFTAESEKALENGIREYLADPCNACWGGEYSWKELKRKRETARK